VENIPEGIVTLAELYNPGFHTCEAMYTARHSGTTNALRIDLEEKEGKVVATLVSTDGSRRNVTSCEFCNQNFEIVVRMIKVGDR
jgi:hypothetical protein